MHIAYCEGFGLTEEEVKATQEDVACTSYTRYVLDIGSGNDSLALLVAMAPCTFGYNEIGKMLLEDHNTKHDGNPYYEWILSYGQSEAYLATVDESREQLEKKAADVGPERIEELVDIFAHATKMELGFWTMGMTMGGSDKQYR